MIRRRNPRKDNPNKRPHKGVRFTGKKTRPPRHNLRGYTEQFNALTEAAQERLMTALHRQLDRIMKKQKANESTSQKDMNRLKGLFTLIFRGNVTEIKGQRITVKVTQRKSVFTPAFLALDKTGEGTAKRDRIVFLHKALYHLIMQRAGTEAELEAYKETYSRLNKFIYGDNPKWIDLM